MGLIGDSATRVIALERDKTSGAASAAQSMGSGSSTVGPPLSARSAATYINPYSAAQVQDPDGLQAEYRTSPKKRRIIRLGGFPANTSSELVTPVLGGIRQRFTGIVGAYPTSQITNKALLIFRDNASAWSLRKGMERDQVRIRGRRWWADQVAAQVRQDVCGAIDFAKDVRYSFEREGPFD